MFEQFTKEKICNHGWGKVSNLTIEAKARTLRAFQSVYRSWFDDTVLKRMYRNAGYLIAGDTVATLLRLVTLAIIARALGVEDFGTLVLIQAYVAIIDRIVNFQSWQALIKFGSDHLERENNPALDNLFKFGLGLDFSTAIAGALIAAALSPVIGSVLDWNEQVVWLAVLYSLAIAFNLEGTAIAILRFRNKFSLLSVHRIFAALLKLIAASIAFSEGGGLITFVVISLVGQILGYLVLTGLAFREFGKAGMAPLRRGRLREGYSENPKILTFLVTTNIHATFRMLPSLVDVMIVGAVLGSGATGLYKVVKEFGQLIARVVQPLYQSVYPEFTKYAAKQKYRKIVEIGVRSASLVAVVAAVFWGGLYFLGDTVIRLGFGSAYLGAFVPLLWYAVGAVISAIVFPITPALLALGRPRLPLYVIIGSSLIYLILLPAFLKEWGLLGGGIAYLAFLLIWTLVMGVGLLITSRRVLSNGAST